MTNQEILKVVQAAIDGKTIEYRHLDYNWDVTQPWAVSTSPRWDFFDNEYRVKPCPIKWWIEFSSQGIPTGNWTGIEPVNGNYRLIEVTE